MKINGMESTHHRSRGIRWWIKIQQHALSDLRYAAGDPRDSVDFQQVCCACLLIPGFAHRGRQADCFDEAPQAWLRSFIAFHVHYQP